MGGLSITITVTITITITTAGRHMAGLSSASDVSDDSRAATLGGARLALPGEKSMSLSIAAAHSCRPVTALCVPPYGKPTTAAPAVAEELHSVAQHRAAQRRSAERRGRRCAQHSMAPRSKAPHSAAPRSTQHRTLPYSTASPCSHPNLQQTLILHLPLLMLLQLCQSALGAFFAAAVAP